MTYIKLKNYTEMLPCTFHAWFIGSWTIKFLYLYFQNLIAIERLLSLTVEEAFKSKICDLTVVLILAFSSLTVEQYSCSFCRPILSNTVKC